MSQLAPQKPNTIADLIRQQMPAIAMVIGGSTPAERNRRAERFARIALTAVRQNPKLAQCSMDSFAASLMTCAQLDLEPNTPQQLAHLIPYKGECTFQLGYPGLMELAYRTGKVSTFHADVVYEKDVQQGLFSYSKGLDPTIKHLVDILGDAREGEIVAAYAVAKMKDGGVIFRVIDRKDVKRAQKTSSGLQYALQNGKKESSPWQTSPDSMWMKTAIKRLCSFLPRTEQLSLAIELDDKAERGESQLPEIPALTGAEGLNAALAGVDEAGIVKDTMPETLECKNGSTVRTAVECAKCEDKAGNCPHWAYASE